MSLMPEFKHVMGILCGRSSERPPATNDTEGWVWLDMEENWFYWSDGTQWIKVDGKKPPAPLVPPSPPV